MEKPPNRGKLKSVLAFHMVFLGTYLLTALNGPFPLLIITLLLYFEPGRIVFFDFPISCEDIDERIIFEEKDLPPLIEVGIRRLEISTRNDEIGLTDKR